MLLMGDMSFTPVAEVHWKISDFTDTDLDAVEVCSSVVAPGSQGTKALHTTH